MRTHTISKLRPVTIAAQQLKTRLRKAGPAQPDVEACSSNAANALTMCVSASVNMINGKKHRSGLSTTYALASISGKDLQSQRIAPVFHADAGRPFRPIAVMAEQLKVIPRETVFAQPVTHMETRANGGGVFMPSAIDVINGQELCSSLSAIGTLPSICCNNLLTKCVSGLLCPPATHITQVTWLNWTDMACFAHTWLFLILAYFGRSVRSFLGCPRYAHIMSTNFANAIPAFFAIAEKALSGSRAILIAGIAMFQGNILGYTIHTDETNPFIRHATGCLQHRRGSPFLVSLLYHGLAWEAS